MTGELVVFIGVFITTVMVALAFTPKAKPYRPRNSRRVIIRARGVSMPSNKLGED